MTDLSFSIRQSMIRSLLAGHSVKRTAAAAATRSDAVTAFLIDRGAAAWTHHCRLAPFSVTAVMCGRTRAFSYIRRRNAYAPETNDTLPAEGWAWFAIDPDTGFVVDWAVGSGESDAAMRFLTSVRARLSAPTRLSVAPGVVRLSTHPDGVTAPLDLPDRETAIKLERMFGRPPVPRAWAGQDTPPEPAPSTPPPRGDFDIRATNLHRALSFHFAAHNLIGGGHGTPPAMRLGVSDRPWTAADLADLPAPTRDSPAPGGLA